MTIGKSAERASTTSTTNRTRTGVATIRTAIVTQTGRSTQIPVASGMGNNDFSCVAYILWIYSGYICDSICNNLVDYKRLAEITGGQNDNSIMDYSDS